MRAIAIALGLTALPAGAMAKDHQFEVDVTAGYRFGGGIDVELEEDDTTGDTTEEGRVSADGSGAFGGIFSYRWQSNGFIFLSYSRQDTTFRYRPNSIDAERLEVDGSIEYFQFGGNLEAHRNRLTPYVGFSIGATRFASDGVGRARFSLALDAGAKLEILPFLHLRLLGRVPMTFSSGELYCFSGRGCAAVLRDNPFVQGEIHGGIGLEF